MFEGLVRQLIWGYLGKYIKDIQKEQLKITLWNGNCVKLFFSFFLIVSLIILAFHFSLLLVPVAIIPVRYIETSKLKTELNVDTSYK